MLSTKPINEISFQDVVEFCSELNKENLFLEYKSEFPSNNSLAKEISAFANTNGGLLIIGVDDVDSIPRAPFEGFTPDQTNYEQKIEQILISRVKPPLFPQVKVTEQIDGKIFIVIRISESDITPHIIDTNKIYIRTGESSNPLDTASWDKALWLHDRRKKSISFREFLLNESEECFNSILGNRSVNLSSNEYKGIISAKILPLYPNNQSFIDLRELTDVCESIRFRINNTWHFPAFRVTRYNSIHHGINSIYFPHIENQNNPSAGDNFEYLYFNKFGHFAWILNETRLNNDGSRLMYLSWLFEYILMFLHASNEYYKKLDYKGSCKLILEFEKLDGLIVNTQIHERQLRPENILSQRGSYSQEYDIDLVSYNDDFKNITKDMLEDVAWSLGASTLVKSNLIETYIENLVIESQ